MDQTLFWRFRDTVSASLTRYPPEQLDLPYGKPVENSPFRTREYQVIHKGLHDGYETQPSDCPAIRAISKHGILIRNPGEVRACLLPRRLRFPVFENDWAARDFVKVSGARLADSDSGFLASWITGSRFIKIQTGIEIYYPAEYFLLQAPIPNGLFCAPSPPPGVSSGLEFSRSARCEEIGNRKYCRTDINVIVALPNQGELYIEEGALLQWITLVPKGVACRPFPSFADNKHFLSSQ